MARITKTKTKTGTKPLQLSQLVATLTKKEIQFLKRLNTPIKIQKFLDTLPFNHEEKGETYRSVRYVLQNKTAHCLEGALVAALAFYVNGETPLIMDFKVDLPDIDHVVTLYKRGGRWGAISKTNHATVRYRDPIYLSVRELAASYFHEYFLPKTGRRTLRKYSDPIDLRFLHTHKLGKDMNWVTGDEGLWDLPRIIDAVPHHDLFPKKNLKYIRNADKMEMKAGNFVEWKPKLRKFK